MKPAHDKISTRFAKPEDAEDFIRLQQNLARESAFMMLTADEVAHIDAVQQRQKLEAFAKGDSPAKVLFAFAGDEMAGYMGYMLPGPEKIRHEVRGIGIGVRAAFQGRGVATALFSHAQEHWRSAGRTVARLSVMEPNDKAFRLYTKLGFRVEGEENMSIRMNGQYIRQKLMWKDLGG